MADRVEEESRRGPEGRREKKSRREVVLLPVKSFSMSKRRLAPALSSVERSDLSRRLAESVMQAAAPLDVVVVCEDPDVVAWAEERGAAVSVHPAEGLNGALQLSARHYAEEGYARVTVVHADIPRAEGLARLAADAAPNVALLVPDQQRNGTNVLSLPAAAITGGADFSFSYGAGSFERHRAEAHRVGLIARIVEGTALSIDIDLPEDLVHLTWV